MSFKYEYFRKPSFESVQKAIQKMAGFGSFLIKLVLVVSPLVLSLQHPAVCEILLVETLL